MTWRRTWRWRSTTRRTDTMTRRSLRALTSLPHVAIGKIAAAGDLQRPPIHLSAAAHDPGVVQCTALCNTLNIDSSLVQYLHMGKIL